MPPRPTLAPAPPGRKHRHCLLALTGVFAGRVVAQPLALIVTADALPRFDTWHSGALPYPVLLGSQIAILGWMLRTARGVGTTGAPPKRSAAAWFLTAGAVYAFGMLCRLVLGATLLRDVHWFASPLPTVFHLGLAAYLLTYGHFHLQHGAQKT